jgi:hypothetical protein
MKKYYTREGFVPTLIAAMLIVSIALITQFRKDLFVEESGSLKVFGTLGILLAVGLVLRWRRMREIMGVIVGLSLLMMVPILVMTANTRFFFNYVILSILLSVTLYLLIFSKAVKNYISAKNDVRSL